MPILHSFEENKLEYEDEDEVEIMMMGTGMDKESLEHNLYEDDITLIFCHNFSPTSNPPIKPKDSGNFRMKSVETTSQIVNQNLLKIMLTKRGDGVTSIKRRRHDLRSDGVSTLVSRQNMDDLKEL
ncbi:hypothetical protein Tco_0340348 [Tanacetum coccineum]